MDMQCSLFTECPGQLWTLDVDDDNEDYCHYCCYCSIVHG